MPALARDSPGGKRGVAVPGHIVVRDGGVAVVGGEHDGVTVEPDHLVAVDGDALGALEENRARPLERPVTPCGDRRKVGEEEPV